MKKIILCILIVFGIGTLSFAQEPTFCGTTEIMQEDWAALSPQEKAIYELEQQDYEQKLQQIIADHPEWKEKSHKRGTISYTIPVVFHILHAGGDENISDDQVFDAVHHMNLDYQKSNSEWPNVVSDFLPIVADIEIKFVLAKKDPNGNCTSGITRTLSNQTNSGNGASQLAAIKAAQGNWPGNEYLNIFVCKYIGGAAGYTRLPSSWGGAATSMSNGIYVLANYTGSIGIAGSNTSHTLSHEAGHWLNLSHTWGGTNDPAVASNCNTDDGVADTPNTIGWKVCNVLGSTCSHPGPDNVENFMEYSYCSKMFTEGQKTRMWAALNVSSTGRSNVWSASNLLATGVSQPEVLCDADFSSNTQRVCPGTTITFNDHSYNEATGWNWTFPGGTPATSTDQNPTVTYNTPGTYQVELEATDGSSTKTKTRTDYITVLPAGAALPYIESFEDYSVLEDSPWDVYNQGENEAFEITSSASYSGNQSIRLGNFGEYEGNIDEVISPRIDLSSISSNGGVKLTFRKAYRKRSSSNNEKLQISVSNDCGETWHVRNTMFGPGLGTQTAGSNWTPSSNSDWELVTMTNITSQYWVNNFMFKIEFESDGGNNIYIDDINIETGTLGIDLDEMIHSFYIHPNPAENVANVTFSTGNSQEVEVSLIDMMGQNIQVSTLQAQKGKNSLKLNTANIESGVYFVKLNIGGINQTKRLIIR